MKKTGLEPDAYGRYLLDGGDMVRVLVARCRRRGVAPFVSLRMNDVHMLENVGKKTAQSIWVSRFYEENPDLLLEPDHAQRHPKGYYHGRGQNWAKAQVRERKFGFLAELCENYDLAGVELDWLRDHQIFPKGLPAADRCAIMTGFLRQVRGLLDRTSQGGQRRYLAVRVPLAMEGHGGLGFDVVRAVQAGVDILNCSSWYCTQPCSDLAEIRRLAPAATIFQELTHAAGALRIVSEPDPGGYGTNPFPRTSDEMFYTAARLAYQRGADGISLFNFVYYRMGGGRLSWLVREPPFHVLPRLVDREWLAKQPQLYWLAPWNYLKQVQRPIEPGRSADFRVDAARPKRVLDPSVRLRVICSGPLAGVQLAAVLNDTAGEPTTDVGPPFGYPYDSLLGEHERRRAWVFPSGSLRDGINAVRITLQQAAAPVTPVWLDLALS
jgi:hypothetical protein